MSGNKFVLDTNVIINHLGGSIKAEVLLDQAIIYISSISFTELLSSPKLSTREEKIVRSYLSHVHVVHTNDFISNEAASLRRGSKLKLADALIAATSIYLDLPLVTFDSDFYKLQDIKIIKIEL